MASVYLSELSCCASVRASALTTKSDGAGEWDEKEKRGRGGGTREKGRKSLAGGGEGGLGGRGA